MHRTRVVPHMPNSEASFEKLEESFKKGTKIEKKYSVIEEADSEFPILLDVDDAKQNQKDRVVNIEAMYSQQLYPTPKGRHRWFEPSYLIMSLALAADTANIIDFPVLCFKYGGFAFLVPYTLMICFCVLPVYYMEAIIGQYTRAGAIKVWKLCPLFKGIGWCMIIFNFYDILETQARVAWAGKYLFEVARASFQGVEPPYFGCQNYWNTPNCRRFIDKEPPQKHENPAAEFFHREVLEFYKRNSSDPTHRATINETYNIHELGHLVPHLLICHSVFYAIILIVILSGMKWTVRLSWIAFALGIIGIFVTFIRGLALPGGLAGIQYFSQITNSSKLGEVETWQAATRYAFYSCSIGVGIHLTFSSFNDFGQPILRNCIIVVVIDTLFSIFSTLAVSTFFGYLAYRSNRPLSEVTKISYHMIYELFPNTIATLETQSFYIGTIFVSIICTGVFNTIVRLSYTIICVKDVFRRFFKKYCISKHLFALGLTLMIYFAGFPGLCSGGVLLIRMYDDIFESVSQMLIIFIQVIAIGWIFGVQALNDCHRAMTAKPVNIVYRVMWKVTAPIGVALVLAFSCVRATDSTDYEGTKIDEIGRGIKIIFSIMPGLIVPIFAGLEFFIYSAPTFYQKFCLLISPEFDHEQILLDEDSPRAHLKHYLSLGNAPMGLTVTSQIDFDLDDLETGWILEPDEKIAESEVDDYAFSAEHEVDVDEDDYVGEADFIFLYEKDAPEQGKGQPTKADDSDSDDGIEDQLNKIPLNARVRFILRKAAPKKDEAKETKNETKK